MKCDYCKNEFEEKLGYKCGDVFVDQDEIDLCKNTPYYILAQVDFNKVNLISLDDGNRYVKPMSVIDTPDVTKDEFEKLIKGGKFNKVNNKYNVRLE